MINKKNIPVYNNKGEIVCYVSNSMTSIGVSKILKVKQAEFFIKNGKSGWKEKTN